MSQELLLKLGIKEKKNPCLCGAYSLAYALAIVVSLNIIQ